MSKVRNIPKDWKLSTIGKLLKISTGNQDTQNKIKDGKYPFFVRSNIVEKLDSYSFDGEAVLTAGDGVGVGKVYHYYNGQFAFHQRVYAIYGFNQIINGKYFYRYFSENFLTEVERYSAKNSVDSVRLNMILDMELFLPPIKEQEKISKILSEVDSAIEHTQALHVKHQKIKIALMQDLLTHGIDQYGKIRNPKTHAYKPSLLGDIPVEWDVKEIGKIYKTLRTGSTPSRAIPNYFKGDILWVTSGELKYKPIYDTIEKITKEAVRATNLKIYPSGTFFIAITGLEAEGTRGSCAIIAKEATTNQSCMAFEKNDEIDTHFLFQYYKLHGKYISLLYSQGSKQQSLNNKIVSKILIHLPPKEEQEKIAQILSSHDEKIEKVKTKLEKLKQLKTALMQDLLSGTKRVNHLLGEEQ